MKIPAFFDRNQKKRCIKCLESITKKILKQKSISIYMLFQIPEFIARETEIASWMFCIGISLVICFEMLIKTKRRTDLDDEQKVGYYIWVYFIALTSLAHFLGAYARLYIPIFYDAQVGFILDRVSIVMVNFSYLGVIYYTERSAKPWKIPFSTIILLIAMIYGLFIPDIHANTPQVVILAILITIGTAMAPLTYFYIAYKYSGLLRTRSLKIGTSILILTFGILLQRQNIIDFVPDLILGFESLLNVYWAVVPSSMIIVGVIGIYITYFYESN